MAKALEYVILDASVCGNGRLWSDVDIKVGAVRVVVPAAPQHIPQVAGDATGLRSGGERGRRERQLR